MNETSRSLVSVVERLAPHAGEMLWLDVDQSDFLRGHYWSEVAGKFVHVEYDDIFGDHGYITVTAKLADETVIDRLHVTPNAAHWSLVKNIVERMPARASLSGKDSHIHSDITA